MAPIVPHLAEEIHHVYENEGQDLSTGSSVFMKKWEPLVCVSYSSSHTNSHAVYPVLVAGMGESDCGARNERAVAGTRRCVGTAGKGSG